MANFPFKDATFTSYTEINFPTFNYGSVYYAKINGVITAIKPIAVGIYKSTKQPGSQIRSLEMTLYCHAADGNKWYLNLIGRRVFLTAEAAIQYEKGSRTCPEYAPEASMVKVLNAAGAQANSHGFKQYLWGKASGSAFQTEGKYMFWEDADGRHIEFQKTDKDGNKLYFTQEECVNDNVKVIEFEGKAPKTVGEYTIKREFTVKAESQEEAESIIDEAINKAYKEQLK